MKLPSQMSRLRSSRRFWEKMNITRLTKRLAKLCKILKSTFLVGHLQIRRLCKRGAESWVPTRLPKRSSTTRRRPSKLPNQLLPTVSSLEGLNRCCLLISAQDPHSRRPYRARRRSSEKWSWWPLMIQVLHQQVRDSSKNQCL